MSIISLETTIALTGLSRRTVWRRIAEGAFRKVELPETGNAKTGAARTWLDMSGVLRFADLELDATKTDLMERADHGDADAQLEAGQFFYEMERFEAAFYWFSLAANRNSADAMTMLGRCYAEGIGTKKEEELALMWIAKAAARGHPIAQKQMQGLRS
ncbi:MAG: hypothetical protein LBI31_00450 [Zoogloeaceae bacterium]|jgi:TPR repeat protein|nr:hypothetical protein [Zoogloeaceae bacterium]